MEAMVNAFKVQVKMNVTEMRIVGYQKFAILELALMLALFLNVPPMLLARLQFMMYNVLVYKVIQEMGRLHVIEYLLEL
jgi:hypothetical protein